MPQLDVFTYFNLSFFFICSFFIMYVVTSYCIFPTLNLWQKSRHFFTLSVEQAFLRIDIFMDSASRLLDSNIFVQHLYEQRFFFTRALFDALVPWYNAQRWGWHIWYYYRFFEKAKSYRVKIYLLITIATKSFLVLLFF